MRDRALELPEPIVVAAMVAANAASSGTSRVGMQPATARTVPEGGCTRAAATAELEKDEAQPLVDVAEPRGKLNELAMPPLTSIHRLACDQQQALAEGGTNPSFDESRQRYEESVVDL